MPQDPHPRPLRSVLFVPAVNARALAKAAGLACDAVIVDCEDAVAPARKDEARETACAAVAGLRAPGRAVALRVNAVGTSWHRDDVDAVAAARPDAVVLPKADAASVEALSAALDRAGAREARVWPMVETPAGVLDARAIAGASPRVEALLVGTNDLAAELRVAPAQGRGPLLHALGAVVLAARASRVGAVDGVFNAIDDPAGFAAECAQGASLGFDGKTLIHPAQVEAANGAFSPSPDRVAWARRVVSAFATDPGAGVLTVDGSLVEHLHLREARRLLAIAERVYPSPDG